ncbi:hypothetical protein VTJ83DRAFT_5335 [Remersonia thermophila]|uniref:VWFA domain-containing protein n=1 Tax=Remersonia thermophila TaxID=72144 RepID=A0ABR4D6J1_9PEZI
MAPTSNPPQAAAPVDDRMAETVRRLFLSDDGHHDKDGLVQIHPVPSSSGEGLDGVLVKIQPPKEPKLPSGYAHMPCDIVLSIDVSLSMEGSAPVPSVPGEDKPAEDTGLTILDLVKHAALTIVETLEETDRLGIVVFSTTTEVLQPLTPMTETNKEETRRRIKGMAARCATNLWHGITDGLKLFRDVEGQARPSGRVPALLVLTDGIPNHMCPRQGYVPKLRTMLPLPASIHTFGFGYALRSGLLKSIAEIGGGSYSFIPDAGMIGTVFVHAVANLQSTFANNAKLTLTYPAYLQLQETRGEAVDKQQPILDDNDNDDDATAAQGRIMQLTISLNDLRYGQPRDVYLAYNNTWRAIEVASRGTRELTATLTYQRFAAKTEVAEARCDPLAASVPAGLAPLDPAETAYHVSRCKLIEFLAALAPLDRDEEHVPLNPLPLDIQGRLARLVASMPAARSEFSGDENCRSLLIDIAGEDALAGIYGPPALTSSLSSSSSSSAAAAAAVAAEAAAEAESLSDVTTAVVSLEEEQDSDSDDGDAAPATPTSTAFSSNTLSTSSSFFPSSSSSSSSSSRGGPWWITPEATAAWTGQVALALLHPAYYARWGKHYLPSLAGAHARQACNSFKDAGPLRYGRDSPLFRRCRDRLDEAFDNLPPPEPKPRGAGGGGPGYRACAISMRAYNNVYGGCFAGCSRVLVAGEGGEKGRWVRIGRLRRGMEVVTPRGPRRVVSVVRMPVRRQEMCLVPVAAAPASSSSSSGGGGGGGVASAQRGLGKAGASKTGSSKTSGGSHGRTEGMVLVTPWHPIRRLHAAFAGAAASAGAWEFPKEASVRGVRYTGAVYTVQLERDGDAEAHAMLVNGAWGVTLGHGLTGAVRGEKTMQRDVRSHAFFGDWDKVSASLARLPRKEGGTVVAGGVVRDPKTGLACGFSRAPVQGGGGGGRGVGAEEAGVFCLGS